MTEERKNIDEVAEEKNEVEDLVMMAMRLHLFPYRTQKLSSLAPMILGGQPPGKLGHRQFVDNNLAKRVNIYSTN